LQGERGRATLPAAETLRHRAAKWLFLAPVFARTTRPLRLLPVALGVLAVGALGSAVAATQSLLFFYAPFTAYPFESTALLYLFNWMSLFFFSDAVSYAVFRRRGGELQLFVCLGLASFPLAVFPYLYLLLSYAVARYFLWGLIVWSVLLLSSAYAFSKGLRLDKAVVFSLLVLYLNTAVLLALGRLA
jgi:hypothetical protein